MLHNQRGIIQHTVAIRLTEYKMDSIQECNTDQAKHLHYRKRRSIYMRLNKGGGRRGGGRERARETSLKGEDTEEDKWQGKCGVKVGEVDDRVWEVGREQEKAGCRKGMTRQREALLHGHQFADWWWWEWQWGRKATSLGEKQVEQGYRQG